MDTCDCGPVCGASVRFRFMGGISKRVRVCCAAPVFCVRFCMLVCDNVCALCAHGCYRFADAVLFWVTSHSVCARMRGSKEARACVGVCGSEHLCPLLCAFVRMRVPVGRSLIFSTPFVSTGGSSNVFISRIFFPFRFTVFFLPSTQGHWTKFKFWPQTV